MEGCLVGENIFFVVMRNWVWILVFKYKCFGMFVSKLSVGCGGGRVKIGDLLKYSSRFSE